MLNSHVAAGLIGLVIGVAASFAGYRIFAEPVVQEITVSAPEQRQDDGSLILEREPDAELPAVTVPKGAQVERRGRITVESVGACDPIDIDFALIRHAGGRRVVASSPNGRVLGGVDVPVVAIDMNKSVKWAAGVSYNLTNEGPGLWIDRNFGSAVVGFDVYQRRFNSERDVAVRARVGWRW